jgi:hypothetical protein
VDRYDDFHVVARKEASDRIANLLRSAGIRMRERVVLEIGTPEYIISVHVEDLDRAEEVFSSDLGPGRSFNSGA